MYARVMGLIAVFAVALAVSGVVDSAEARRGHGGGHKHFRSFAVPHTHRGIHYVPMHPRHFHRNYFHAGPRYLPDRCGWLRHRALASGSRYWWQRYRACRSGIPY